jgi:hypothetical protein
MAQIASEPRAVSKRCAGVPGRPVVAPLNNGKMTAMKSKVAAILLGLAGLAVAIPGLAQNTKPVDLIKAGDVLVIKALRLGDRDVTSEVTVDSRGKMTAPFVIGEIQAEGLTLDELATRIQREYILAAHRAEEPFRPTSVVRVSFLGGHSGRACCDQLGRFF